LRILLLRRPRLLPRGARILVALSGGPDSTALLHLLDALAGEHEWTLVSAHFDHALRADSANEAERVAARSEALTIPCVRERANPPPASDQAALRAARYAFLRRAAGRVGADRIATGHQADDQAETVLFRLLRGTGLRGLRGIPLRRGRIVRPLLGLRGRELADWLRERGIPWIEDPSNVDVRWARARIRTRLLPALASGSGLDPVPVLLGLARRASEAEIRLRIAAEALLADATRHDPARGDRRESPVVVDRMRLLAAPPAVRAETLRRLAARRGVRLTRGGTRAGMEFISRGRSGGGVDLGGGLRLERAFDTLVVVGRRGSQGTENRTAAGKEELVFTRADAGAGAASLCLDGREIRVRWSQDDPVGTVPGCRQRRVALSVGPDHYPLRIRGWKPGDRMRTAAGTRKLKKLFGERRVARRERGRTPVLVDRFDRVLWVAGLAVAADVAAGTASANLCIEVDDV
jgi:tRNA(Ile)-lysidine synthase